MENANYNGTELILSSGANIVVVTFNYRVGVLRFLSSNSLGHKTDVNIGLLNQRRLFLWVQRHISKVRSGSSARTTDTNNYFLFSSAETRAILSYKARQLEVDQYHIILRPTEATIKRPFSSEQSLRVLFGPHFELSQK
jgi:hypothetical protein